MTNNRKETSRVVAKILPINPLDQDAAKDLHMKPDPKGLRLRWSQPLHKPLFVERFDPDVEDDSLRVKVGVSEKVQDYIATFGKESNTAHAMLVRLRRRT
ncbi:MAG TPA: hypothetical protein VLH19_02335 [Patescibacteria group bacterium]|nr:hypothetical protein [Patescibacteria group bacterium]